MRCILVTKYQMFRHQLRMSLFNGIWEGRERVNVMGRGRGRSRGRARSRVDEPEMVGASGAASMKLAGGPGRDAPGSVSLVGQRANDDWLKNNSKVDESGKLWFGRGCRPSGQSS